MVAGILVGCFILEGWFHGHNGGIEWGNGEHQQEGYEHFQHTLPCLLSFEGK